MHPSIASLIVQNALMAAAANTRLARGAFPVDEFAKFETVEAVELNTVDGGYLLDDRVVIVGCTSPFPPLRAGQVTWNPWIGQPYPTQI
jgi:hypothetical protein